ncbi:lamin tail domain-containing protein [Botrimarina mediterranea]|uniref:LTD domain-containing protein n=1 Tax=Botrimarina mediterranea TaxID=2528022 RepID=A0A518K7Z0_9BACT|nr:lamin tail domain-containing protein [Botrimarina mediterranea]QDV73913.1 hypothetical protein Spa11_21120 [Botrimarina mediterranea]QDV78543.1 hypothetical protein K2D_21500 [Planctomycetes bacterium K2D]
MAQTRSHTTPLLRCATGIVLAFTLVVSVARGDVIISEIMYNAAGSDSGSGFNKEWYELYNTGDTEVNLTGWRVGDSQDGQWASAFPFGTSIAPGGTLVVTGDATTFDNQWGPGINRIQVGSFPALANSPSPNNETVAIRDAFGAIRDEVNLDQNNGWHRIDGTQGATLSLRPEGLSATANDSGANWLPAAWGAYGASLSDYNGELNHGSPGFVETTPQAPFAPSPDAAWSMAVIPDSQNYSKSSIHAGKFTQMTEWVRDNREAYNIQVVLHEGDIVNNNRTSNPSSGDQTSAQQWANAKASMSVLDGHLPYIMAGGNHDYGTTDAQDRQTYYNDYFKATDNPLIDPAQGGMLTGVMNDGELQNAYFDFVAPDGRKMLVLNLEWEPRPETVAWANSIAALPEYADHTAILLTHAYLTGTNSRYTSSRVAADASGSELWTELVQGNANFEMVFNGHFGGDGSGTLTSAASGHVVHQMFFNTQFETQGGNGWIRIVEFLEDGETVRVRTYSPVLGIERTDPQWSFEFKISDLPSPNIAGDYNGDGFVDAADYTVWRDTLGSTTELAADGDGNGTVNQLDYDVWVENFGAQQGGSPLPTPEPTALVLLIAGVGMLPITRTRRGVCPQHWHVRRVAA